MRGRPNRGAGEARRRAPLRPPQGGPGPGAPLPALEGLLPEGWEGLSFLALDFETTGLDPARERVVEVGALRFSPGPGPAAAEGGALASLVAPGIPIPPLVVAIHGIRDEDVRSAPPFSELAPALLALAEGAIIVAHNAPFDLAFLRHELGRAGLPAPANRVLDTRLLAKAAFPGLPSYKLGELVRSLGLPAGAAHRALDDARACAALFLAAAPRIEEGRRRRAGGDEAAAPAKGERGG